MPRHRKRKRRVERPFFISEEASATPLTWTTIESTWSLVNSQTVQAPARGEQEQPEHVGSPFTETYQYYRIRPDGTLEGVTI